MSVLKRFNNNFRQFSDLALFVRIVGLSSFMRLALRVFNPLTIIKWLDRGRTSNNQLPIQKAAKFTDFVIRPGTPSRCLKRSLVMFRLARRAGLPVTINFGLDKQIAPATELRGHSWISIGDRQVVEPNDTHEKFKITYSYKSKLGSHQDSSRMPHRLS